LFCYILACSLRKEDLLQVVVTVWTGNERAAARERQREREREKEKDRKREKKSMTPSAESSD